MYMKFCSAIYFLGVHLKGLVYVNNILSSFDFFISAVLNVVLYSGFIETFGGKNFNDSLISSSLLSSC